MPWEEGMVTLGEKSSQFTDIVQLVERLPHQKNVVGSNPAIGTKYESPLLPHNSAVRVVHS